MQLVIKNGMILQGNGSFLPGHIGIDNGKIAALWYGDIPDLKPDLPPIDVINAKRFLVSPGFIDTHMHGALGFSLAGCQDGGWEKLEKRLSAAGITSILSTCECLPFDTTVSFIDRTLALADKNDSNLVDVVGIHMEGPYMNKNKRGCQWEEFIRLADKNEIKQFLERARGQIKVWSLAPEFDENMAAIRMIASSGISVSIAHTEADYSTAMAAFSAGASRVTHTFNAMPPINHRYEGIISAAWQHGAFMELIADGQHVSPTIMRMFIHATDPGKIVLVSDNNELSGMREGEYVQYGHRLIIKNRQIRLAEGNLAGTYETLNKYAWNLTLCGFSPGAAIRAASENPARSARVFDRKGSIAIGKDADLVILDDEFEAMLTVKRGRVVYQSEHF